MLDSSDSAPGQGASSENDQAEFKLSSNGELAYVLALYGYRVFPAYEYEPSLDDKKPKIKSPYPGIRPTKDATQDLDKIKDWWRQYPGAAVGMYPTSCGKVIVDTDNKPGKPNGVAAFKELAKQHGDDISGDLISMTPNDGEHYAYKDEGFGCGTGKLPAGIDVKGHNGYIIAPGTTMADGSIYRPVHEIHHARPMPQWLKDLIGASRAPRESSTANHEPKADYNVPHTPTKLEDLQPELSSADIDKLKDETETDRNKRTFRGALLLARLNYPLEAITGVLMCKDNKALHEHVAAQGKKLRAAVRAARRAIASVHDAQYGGFGPVPPGPEPQPEAAQQASSSGQERPTLHALEPIDPWAQTTAALFPNVVLPAVIEDFARTKAEIMGADPAGLAMAALTVCAASIPDSYRLKVKKYDNWTQPAKLWTMLVGPPSTSKSPIIGAAVAPLATLERIWSGIHDLRVAHHEGLDKDKRGKPPALRRYVVNSTTPEALQEICRSNPNGVLTKDDELSGWFGALDKDVPGKGASAARAQWLKAYDGGQFTADRIGRGHVSVANFSTSILGGVQTERIQAISANGIEDGLMQRFNPILLATAPVGRDEPRPNHEAIYRRVVVRLSSLPARTLTFTPDAQAVYQEATQRHHSWWALEKIDERLAAHIGKYNGMLARLAVIWHALEGTGHEIDARTIDRARTFLHEFLLSHAVAFYRTTLGERAGIKDLRLVCGHILTGQYSTIQPRDIQRVAKLPDARAAQKIGE